MKKILIMSVFILLGLILIYFYQTPIKGLLRDYLPIYTKSYINELNNEKILKFIPKDQAIEAFRSFFILEDKLFLQKRPTNGKVSCVNKTYVDCSMTILKYH